MSGNRIITIGREFGSGGKLIGMKLAERLGVKCYDKELLDIASDHSGLCKEIMEHNDEKPVNSFFYSLVTDVHSGSQPFTGYMNMPLNQKVFLAQFEAIQKLADREPCVIVGRCADYALASHDNITSVFVSGALPDKVERVAALYNISKDKAMDLIPKTDKKRANYYNYYSNKKWGSAASYDLCINSSPLGIEKTAKVLATLIEKMEKA